MRRLEGRVAIVTGGASGIGEATARLFAAEGARVVLGDIQEEAGRAVAKSLGGGAVFQPADVTRDEDVAGLVGRAVADFGRLDVMFNNAGALGARGSLLDLGRDDFDRTMALLVRSVFLGMVHAGRAMRERGGGVILSTSSIAGLCPGSGPHLYTTAKAAVIHLTKSAALELGEYGIRVNCLCPGGVPTPLVAGALGLEGEAALESIRRGMRETQAIKRAGTPEDVARAALFLASDEAEYITGVALPVDGGESVGPPWSRQVLK